MAAPKTVLTYPLNGAQKDFAIPFEYLARKFITVTLIGKVRKPLTLNSDYRFTSRTNITTTKAWGPGDEFESIEVRRVTSATERLIDFSDGSILRAYDLNTAQLQALHISEEARDITADTIGVNNSGDLDGRGRKIVNVSNATEDGDAVSFRQIKNLDQQHRFLTPKSSPPTLRDDGGALQVGDRFLLITDGIEYIYKVGGMWQASNLDSDILASVEPAIAGAATVGNAAKVVNASQHACIEGTDITAALNSAARKADRLRWPLVLDIDHAYLTGDFEPPLKFHGNYCTLSGGRVVGNRLKHLQWDGLTCSELLLSGVWHANVNNFNVLGRWTVDGNDSDFGSLWNTFNNVRCGQIILDVRYQAVNQNQFTNCMGNTPGVYGLLITDGGAATSPTGGVMEAHNNVFQGCDFSHSKGCWNDIKVRNHDNILIGCYFERGAIPVGRWIIMGCQLDGSTIPLVPSRSHVFGMTDVSPATSGDSLSLTATNLCKGGDWTVRKGGKPVGFSSTVPGAGAVVVSDFVTPWGYQAVYGGRATNGYQTLSVDFKSPTGKFSAVVWMYLPDGDFPKAVSVVSDGAESFRGAEMVPERLGVYLFRVSGDVTPNVQSSIRFYQTLTQISSGRMYIGAAFVSPMKAAIYPSFPNAVEHDTAIDSAGVERKRGVQAVKYSTASVLDVPIRFAQNFDGPASSLIPQYSLEVVSDYGGNFQKSFIKQGSVSTSGFDVRIIVGGTGEFAGAIRWSCTN
ncbi:phage tail fiber protein [Pseudomonas fontis]|uniref:Phage tail fiber protein n=1 Tax=Pseudomonas fontis TaxID=2942633 RepID=A0ABT5NKZ6_9PSED|nr:phage tail fiber protein [Pseudomonas fontis]MDD0975430.1 phage tail fiber protein [Pseudomonas fontis]MDD0989207.1 phage tail fiber protein [Pseudomonas fontis]